MIVADESADRSQVEKETAHSTDAPARRCVLRVDHSERHATLLHLARTCLDFDVRMDRLDIGDYCIDGRVVIERKTYADFAMSLADGRLFPQAAALARSPHRPVVLLEGPKPAKMPGVHPHALKGAMVSLAVMWRLPVLHARDPEDSLRVLPSLHISCAIRIRGFCNGTTGSRNVLVHGSSTSFRACQELVRHWRVGCCFSSAPSSAWSPRMKTR